MLGIGPQGTLDALVACVQLTNLSNRERERSGGHDYFCYVHDTHLFRDGGCVEVRLIEQRGEVAA